MPLDDRIANLDALNDAHLRVVTALTNACPNPADGYALLVSLVAQMAVFDDVPLDDVKEHVARAYDVLRRHDGN